MVQLQRVGLVVLVALLAPVLAAQSLECWSDVDQKWVAASTTAFHRLPANQFGGNTTYFEWDHGGKDYRIKKSDVPTAGTNPRAAMLWADLFDRPVKIRLVNGEVTEAYSM